MGYEWEDSAVMRDPSGLGYCSKYVVVQRM